MRDNKVIMKNKMMKEILKKSYESAVTLHNVLFDLVYSQGDLDTAYWYLTGNEPSESVWDEEFIYNKIDELSEQCDELEKLIK